MLKLLETINELRSRVELIVIDWVQSRKNSSHFARTRQFDEVYRSISHIFEAVLTEAVCIYAQVDPLVCSKLIDWNTGMEWIYNEFFSSVMEYQSSFGLKNSLLNSN